MNAHYWYDWTLGYVWTGSDEHSDVTLCYFNTTECDAVNTTERNTADCHWWFNTTQCEIVNTTECEIVNTEILLTVNGAAFYSQVKPHPTQTLLPITDVCSDGPLL